MRRQPTRVRLLPRVLAGGGRGRFRRRFAILEMDPGDDDVDDEWVETKREPRFFAFLPLPCLTPERTVRSLSVRQSSSNSEQST